MNKLEARTYRAAYDGAVKRYSKMTKIPLRNEWLTALSQASAQCVYGGPVSKDELISAILDLRGYTIAKWNESTHVLAHEPGLAGSSACEWCRCQVTWRYREAGSVGEFLAQCTGQPGHGGEHRDSEHPESDYAAPVPAVVPTGTGWPVT